MNLHKSFGEMIVLDGIDFEFNPGEMHAIIGPNGAGKTTFVNVMTGVYRLDDGKISLDGKTITRMKTYRRTRAGIGRTFQIPKPFMDLTVMENVLIGAYFGSGKNAADGKKMAAKNLELVGLAGKERSLARELTSAQMKFLDLARALSGSPKYLFIDELAAGLSQTELDNVAGLIQQINESGVCVIYIGHVMHLVKKLGGVVTAMNAGKKIASGSYEEVANQPEVQRVYLGD